MIGTEANDIFVITADGVFGAGRYVGFINVEQLDVDGMEGDDTFIVQSTKANVQTRIFGGLGSDTINVASDAPAVVANDLLGHSGLIEHIVLGGGGWTGTAVDGIAAEIVDDDEPAFVVKPVGGGGTLVDENGATRDAFTIVMTFAPTTDVVVTISRPAPSPFTDSIRSESVELSLDGVNWAPSVTLVFTPVNWNQLRTIHVRAIDDRSSEGELTIPLQSLVIGQLGGSVVAAAGTSVTVGAGALAGQSLLGRTLIVTAPDGTSQARTITGVAGNVLTLELRLRGHAGRRLHVADPRDRQLQRLRAEQHRRAPARQRRGRRRDPARLRRDPARGGGERRDHHVHDPAQPPGHRPRHGRAAAAARRASSARASSAFTFAGATTSTTIPVSALDDPFREGFQFEHIGHALTTVDAFAGAVTAQSPRLDEIAGSFGGLRPARLHRPHHVRRGGRAVALHPPQHRHQAVPAERPRRASGPRRATRSSSRATPRRRRSPRSPAASPRRAGTLITLTAALPVFVGLAGLTGAMLRIIDGAGPGVDALRTIVASSGNTITVDSPFTRRRRRASSSSSST